MKKLALAAALVVTSISAFANDAGTFITSSNSGAEAWYFYESSYVKHTDGYSVMFGKRYPGTTANEERGYMGVEFATCNTKTGTMMFRLYTHQPWVPVVNVSFADGPTTVGDEVAKALCDRATALSTKKKKI